MELAFLDQMCVYETTCELFEESRSQKSLTLIPVGPVEASFVIQNRYEQANWIKIGVVKSPKEN